MGVKMNGHITSQGLTGTEIKSLTEMLIKANDEQTHYLRSMIEGEEKKRKLLRGSKP